MERRGLISAAVVIVGLSVFYAYAKEIDHQSKMEHRFEPPIGVWNNVTNKTHWYAADEYELVNGTIQEIPYTPVLRDTYRFLEKNRFHKVVLTMLAAATFRSTILYRKEHAPKVKNISVTFSVKYNGRPHENSHLPPEDEREYRELKTNLNDTLVLDLVLDSNFDLYKICLEEDRTGEFFFIKYPGFAWLPDLKFEKFDKYEVGYKCGEVVASDFDKPVGEWPKYRRQMIDKPKTSEEIAHFFIGGGILLLCCIVVVLLYYLRKGNNNRRAAAAPPARNDDENLPDPQRGRDFPLQVFANNSDQQRLLNNDNSGEDVAAVHVRSVRSTPAPDPSSSEPSSSGRSERIASSTGKKPPTPSKPPVSKTALEGGDMQEETEQQKSTKVPRPEAKEAQKNLIDIEADEKMSRAGSTQRESTPTVETPSTSITDSSASDPSEAEKKDNLLD